MLGALGLILLVIICLLLFKVVAFAIGGPLGLLVAAVLIYLVIKDRNSTL